MKPGFEEIIPGMLTRIWGYNGLYPGPTFLAERGRTMCVRFVNRLEEITSPTTTAGTRRLIPTGCRC